MNSFVRIAQAGGIVAVIFIGLASPANNTAHGQQAAGTPPSQSAPALLDPNLFKWPEAVPSYEFGKLDFGKFRQDLAEPKPPDQIEFGNSTLRLDTSHNVIDFVPRAATDAPDLNDVLAWQPRRKRSRGLQDNFGLKFTTPTH
jgi:hypothetical protein